MSLYFPTEGARLMAVINVAHALLPPSLEEDLTMVSARLGLLQQLSDYVGFKTRNSCRNYNTIALYPNKVRATSLGICNALKVSRDGYTRYVDHNYHVGNPRILQNITELHIQKKSSIAGTQINSSWGGTWSGRHASLTVDPVLADQGKRMLDSIEHGRVLTERTPAPNFSTRARRI